MADAPSQIPAARLAEYDMVIATAPDVERKGAKLPYTSRNGHMFSFLAPDGTLALRLPPDERRAFSERYGAALHVAHGRVMREYVSVPDELLADTDALRPWFLAAVAWIETRKPKTTTRKR
jgi:hypothetical protein